MSISGEPVLGGEEVRVHLEGVGSGDRARQNAAFTALMQVTRIPVPWAYEVWEALVALLTDGNNRTRAIAAQVLCNLAKSDPEERIVDTLDDLLEVTRDERFVTARHCMQSLWKVGVAGPAPREKLLDGLETRFRECLGEKNHTLIRFDILECMRKVYDQTQDGAYRDRALEWIETEADPKYRKKYARLWRDA